MNKIYVYLVAIIINLFAANVYACSCASVPEKQKYSDASDVFVGKVVATKLFTKIEKFDEIEIASDYVEAKISIIKTIKGAASNIVNVLDSVSDGANCAVGLTTGREYLFYLMNNNLISICGGTRLYDEFSDQELIEELMSYLQ